MKTHNAMESIYLGGRGRSITIDLLRYSCAALWKIKPVKTFTASHRKPSATPTPLLLIPETFLFFGIAERSVQFFSVFPCRKTIVSNLNFTIAWESKFTIRCFFGKKRACRYFENLDLNKIFSTCRGN